MIWTATAPGKALLAGEYAVLQGAPAICVAVDRTASAFVAAGRGTSHSPFTVAALDAAARIADDPSLLVSGALAVDSTGLYQGRDKLGIGSSAAVTVAALGAALASRGVFVEETVAHNLPSDARWITRQAFFEAADLAHAEAQGARGSGVDIATAVFGGAIRFERGTSVKVTPATLPAGLALTFVFTGESASTPALIGRVRQLAERDPQRHEELMARLVAAAHAFADALADAARTVAAAEAYGAAMAALGDAADAPIVTPAHAALRALAAECGGAAKPSGAGGGDLGVVFTATSDATLRVHRALQARPHNLSLLSLTAPAAGLSLTRGLMKEHV